MARTPESRPAAPSAAPEREPRVSSKFETLFCEIPFPDDVELSPSNLLWLRVHNKALWPSGDCDQLAVYFFDDNEEICEAFVVGGIHNRQPVVLTYAQLQGLVGVPRNSDPVPEAKTFDPATTTEGDLLAIPFGEEDRVPFQSSDTQEEGPVDVDESGVSEQENGTYPLINAGGAPVQPTEQLPETETSEPSEPPAEFIKKLEEIRATFDVPLVREYYNNLSAEELQQVARLAWWIVSDIGKKWLIYGKPNGFRHPGHGGMIEHGIGVVPIEKRDNAFVENYRRIMANFFQKHSAEMVMSEPNDEYRQQMDIWLGPPLREDVSDKQSQAYRLFHLSTTNPGGDATLYDNRPTGYEHSFFLRWNSPFFEWLRETEDLRPLTFAIREAAVYLDPDTANQRTKKPFLTHNWVAGGFELNGKATLTDSGNQTDGSEGFAAVHTIDYEQKADAADAVGITTRTLTASFPNYQEFARVLATNTRFKRTPPPQNWLSNKGTMRWIKPMTESHHAGDEDYFSVDLKTGKTQ